MPKPPNLNAVTDIKELIRYINTLDDKGRKIMLDAINTQLSDAKKAQILRAIKDQVAITDTAVRNWLAQGIAKSYVAGANFAVKSLQSIKFKPTAGMPALSPINVEMLRSSSSLTSHLEAVNTLLSSAYTDFGKTMTGYVQGAENILNDALRRQVRSKIAEGRLEGTSIGDIAKTVKSTIGDAGFNVLIDRGGREWQLGHYSEMLTRTHINKAANEAAINRTSDFGVDIVQVSEHGATDEACASEEGKIYSISGNSEEYPSLDGHEPPFHPNCTHNLIPRPDLQ